MHTRAPHTHTNTHTLQRGSNLDFELGLQEIALKKIRLEVVLKEEEQSEQCAKPIPRLEFRGCGNKFNSIKTRITILRM